MRFRPAARILHEGLHFRQFLRIELAACLGDLQHVTPCGKRVMLDAEIVQCKANIVVQEQKIEHFIKERKNLVSEKEKMKRLLR